MMGSRSALANRDPFQVLEVQIEREASRPAVHNRTYREEEAANWRQPRNFTLGMGSGMSWTINGRSIKMKDVARDESVKLDTLEA